MLQRLELVVLALISTTACLHAASAQPSLGETTVRVVPSARAAEIRALRDTGYIEISGDIRQAAVTRLAEAFPQARRTTGMFTNSGEPIVRVLVNSQGGEVLAAIQMGQIIRSQAAEVWVAEDAECSSACIFILAGGVSRSAVPGSKLGIHRPFFPPEEFATLSHDQAQEKYAALADGVKAYLTKMGIGDTLYNAMMRVPSRKMAYIGEDFADSTRLLGDDPAYQEWQRAKDQQVLGKGRQEQLDHYLDCMNRNKPKRECERFLLGWNR